MSQILSDQGIHILIKTNSQNDQKLLNNNIFYLQIIFSKLLLLKAGGQLVLGDRNVEVNQDYSWINQFK